MEHINTIQGVIVFTDLKDFTLKTSLLTQKQIDKILDDQDKLMLLNLKKYRGELIKTIGDSYMIFFQTPLEALYFSIEIQKLLANYNEDKKIPLHKIEIRISLNYGELNKKDTLNGQDYFGDSVNLSARVLSKTIETRIFMTDKFYEKIKTEKLNCRFNYLGTTTFKGILYEVGVYEVIYKDHDITSYDKGEFIKGGNQEVLINEKTKQRCKNVDDIIFKCSCINTIISMQPIPFIDIYSSMSMYLYMLHKISIEYHVTLSKKQSKEILTTIISAIGGTLAIHQMVNGIGKIGLIGIAGFLFAPLYFGITFGIGKVMNNYFYYQTKELTLNNTEIKELFLSAKDYGVKYAKENKKEIISIGKDLKNEFLNFTKKNKKDIDEVTNEIKNLKNDKKNI